MGENKLTAAQMRAISYILECNTIEEAAKKSRVSRGTLYNWLKQECFKSRLEEERKAFFEEALNLLKASTKKAAETLIQLLDSNDRTTKRLAAIALINFGIKAAEIIELEERVTVLEELFKREKYRLS